MKRWMLIVSMAIISAPPGISNGEPFPVPDVAFVYVPGGVFEMGDERGDLWAACRPVHTVKVDAFRMSATEITNAQYCVFLNAARKRGYITVSDSVVIGKRGAYRKKNYIHLSDSFEKSFPGNRCWITYTKKDGFGVAQEHANWPVVCVTWYGAKAFAKFYGWDIPREEEWEYACRGGARSLYGTGGTISEETAKYGNSAVLHPASAGSYPPNPLGLYDMSGNVWEWCDDWYGRYFPGASDNPAGPPEGSWRIMRGGGWSDADERNCRAAARYYSAPKIRSTALGIRVVRRGD
jgi:formylglycine-generating enzyme required for sulfatase activity